MPIVALVFVDLRSALLVRVPLCDGPEHVFREAKVDPFDALQRRLTGGGLKAVRFRQLVKRKERLVRLLELLLTFRRSQVRCECSCALLSMQTPSFPVVFTTQGTFAFALGLLLPLVMGVHPIGRHAM